MSDPRRVEAVRHWIGLAAGDLGMAAGTSPSQWDRWRHVCFHAQQAAEKALKAALVQAGTTFPFHHDLDELCGLLPRDWPLPDAVQHLGDLTDWAVKGRYALPEEMPSQEDGHSALVLARTVFVAIRDELERRGISLDYRAKIMDG